MYELTAESIIFLLRAALLAVLYLFLLFVVRAIRHDVGRAGVARPAAMSARLVVIEPGDTHLTSGEEIALQPETRLGRSGRNSVVLDDAHVSSEHALISLRDDRWWLTDRGSTNGTSVNDRSVRGEMPLSDGDVIAIGRIRLKVAA